MFGTPIQTAPRRLSSRPLLHVRVLTIAVLALANAEAHARCDRETASTTPRRKQRVGGKPIDWGIG